MNSRMSVYNGGMRIGDEENESFCTHYERPRDAPSE